MINILKEVFRIVNMKFLCLLSVLLVLSVMPAYAFDMETTKQIIISIDFLGVFIGVVILISVATTLKSVGGILGISYRYILYGISFQVLALIYTLVFVRFKIYPTPAGVDVHHLLMILGIVFFALAAYKLKLIKTKT